MNILRYRLIDPDNLQDIGLLLQWYSDPKIRHFSFPHLDALAYRLEVQAEPLRLKLQRKMRGEYRMYIVTWNGKPIGEMSIEIGGGQLKKHRPKSAWIGLVIGEESARGQGLGARIMAKVEQIAAEMGARRIELSVFEFNRRAIGLYEKLGYIKFGRQEETTFWRGRLRGSHHMEKLL